MRNRGRRAWEVAARGRRGTQLLRALVVAVLAGLLLAYLSSLNSRSPGYSVLADGVLGNAVLVLPAAVCLARAAFVRAQRVAFLLLGASAAAFALGNLVYVFHVQFLSPLPYPSVADIGYLGTYPLLLAALLTLAYTELRKLSLGAFLDGLLSGLSCAAAGSILTVQPVLSTLDGSTFALIVGASYPVADLVLAALIVAIVTLKGGRPGSTWLWLGAGVVTFAVADTQYLYRVADGSYTVGTPLDGLWAVGLNLMAVAAVLPYHPGGLRSAQTPKALVRPNIFSFVGVGVLVFGSLSHHRLPVYAVILTTVTLLTAVQRTAVGFSALRLLAVSQLQARTDELTQLPNRRHFDGQVQRILATRKPGEDLAMMMVDLDGFKAINDSFGHHAGDELLRQIGPRLRRELRTGDLLARLGGDEFGVLLRDSDRAQAFAIATRVAAGIAQPFLIDGVFQTATASIGIALCPDDGADLAVLLQRADAAMFDAKFRGAGVMNYEPQLHNRDHDRLNVRGALEQRELIVDYQPQFALSDGRMVAVEALVRWRHPVRGLLMPNDFLAFFEQAGLMAELTLQVLEIGARDCRQWHLDGTDLQLSVNLAPSALLQDDLVEAISDVLDRHGRTPASLTLEITENVLVMGFERSLETLTRLRALGIQLSLDDYGTGYCSLTYLRDLPVNEVKIDRSFVLTLCPGSTDAAIVASTVQLVRALGLRTVAEGVETPLALSTLRELGCDVVQGFLLGRPMPASQVLRSGKPSSMDRAGAEIRSG